GGLDSILAAKVLMDQGIEVTGLSFKTPFFGPKDAIKSAKKIEIPLIIKDITLEHLEIVKNPKYGFGANMNPCIDCHALMIREAGKMMEEEGYNFIFTGEVLNERPMSQTKKSLMLVARLSGYSDYLLRPLSAKLLPETRPERDGLVDRGKLLDIQGRSRKKQLELIKQYRIKEYPIPAGGCLLTDLNFSRRLKEVFAHNRDCSIRDLELLKVGRHFRIHGQKVIVGRNQKENQKLTEMVQENDVLLSAEHIPGPIGLICEGGSKGLIKKVAGLCARYSDAKNDDRLPVIYKIGTNYEEISPQSVSEDEINSLRI
ncbi:MAG: tRNA 4-thiouridine(8) synthase ThiI, partial [Deltaproteobacteria bacterium]|nr:tRNA 4-thiouridine(8) synthase ThiI [Deltaproteobacteria bacterium]